MILAIEFERDGQPSCINWDTPAGEDLVRYSFIFEKSSLNFLISSNKKMDNNELENIESENIPKEISRSIFIFPVSIKIAETPFMIAGRVFKETK